MKMIWFIFHSWITQTRLGSWVWRRALIIPVDQVVLQRDPVIRGEDFLSKRGQSWSPFLQLSSSPGMNLGWHHIDSPVPAASVSETQDVCYLTSNAEVIMTNVKLRPADSSGRPFFFSSRDCPHMTPECETPTLRGHLWCRLAKNVRNN